MTRYIILVPLVVLLAACATPVIVTPDFSALTPSPTVTPTPEVTPLPAVDSEAEYYRGVYDVCQWVAAQAGRPMDCMQFVERARANGWYEQPSAGWRWVTEPSY